MTGEMPGQDLFLFFIFPGKLCSAMTVVSQKDCMYETWLLGRNGKRKGNAIGASFVFTWEFIEVD